MNDAHAGSLTLWTVAGTLLVQRTARTRSAMRYAIIIEKSETGYGAYVPDLPGCVAVAETEAEVRELIREAIELHLGDQASAFWKGART